MATTKQIAARKKFAEMARSGAFKHRKKTGSTVTKKPRKRRGVKSSAIDVPPTPRLFGANPKRRRAPVGAFTARQRTTARAVLRGTSSAMSTQDAGRVLGAKKFARNPKFFAKHFPKTSAAYKSLKTSLRVHHLMGEGKDGVMYYYAGDRFSKSKKDAIPFANEAAVSRAAAKLRSNASVKAKLVRLHWS